MRINKLNKPFAALFLALCWFSPAMAAGNGGSIVNVSMNRAEIIELDKPMAEVMVADPSIADIVVHDTKKISVVGKKIGGTNIRFFGQDNKVIKYVDVVVGYDLPAIRRTVKKFYPDQNITVQMINNSIAVSGVVPDAETANRILQIVYEFVKESRRDDTTTTSTGAGGDNKYQGVLNLLRLNSSQQVMLKVRVGEVKRNALKRLGFNLQSVTSAGNSLFSFGSGAGGLNIFNTTGAALGNFGTSALSSDTFGAAGATLTRGNFGVSGVLDVLERDGLFRLLAEPNLTAVSGETASFLAGGEFPIATTSGLNGTEITFKEYGVSVSFTPYVLSGNRIRMSVAPELSELTSTGAVTSGGVQIPALTTRRSSTTVELAPGEAFMIAGLIRDQLNSAVNEVPGIAELPIISALMRSTEYQREETELVIAVTPYIVDPVVSSDIRLPVDEFRTPSMMEMFFYGALGSISGDDYRAGQAPLEGPVGFMVD